LLFSCSQYHYPKVSTPVLIHTFRSMEDSTINESNNNIYGINEGWNIYKDIIFAGTKIEGTISSTQSFIPGDTVLNCRITGGDTYNNLFFTYTLAKKLATEKWHFSEANEFVYSLDFFIDNYLDCSYPNNSELEGLEFTFQQSMPPYSFLWGIQWSKSNIWSYWDDTKIKGKATGWIKLPGLNNCMLNKEWNNIYIIGHRDQTGLYYDSLCLNNSCHLLKKFVAKNLLPPTWVENYLQVGFQINGNKAIRKDHIHGVDPVSAYLNNIQLQVRRVGN